MAFIRATQLIAALAGLGLLLAGAFGQPPDDSVRVGAGLLLYALGIEIWRQARMRTGAGRK